MSSPESQTQKLALPALTMLVIGGFVRHYSGLARRTSAT